MAVGYLLDEVILNWDFSEKNFFSLQTFITVSLKSGRDKLEKMIL